MSTSRDQTITTRKYSPYKSPFTRTASVLFSNPRIRFPLAGLNFAGGVLVIYTNFWPRQMEQSSALFWIFIPDCAVAAILTATALLWPDQRGKVVQLMASITCVQNGVSYFVLICYRSEFLTPTALVAHLGLLLEGLALMICMGALELSQALGGISWPAINNVIDLTTDTMAYSLVLVPQSIVIVTWVVTDLCLIIWTIEILLRSSKSKPILTAS